MVLLAVNWTNAWIMTLLGFSLVVVLLILLVFVLQLFGSIMVRANAPKKEKVQKPVAVASADAAVNADITGEELAAIAMALQLSKEPAHDNESNVLTIVSDPTSAWSSKVFGINNLDR